MMDPAIQWFIFGMVSNEMATVEYCQSVFDSLSEKNVEAFAQSILNLMVEGMQTQDEVDNALENIQQLLNYAVEQAATGAVPDLFADGAATAASVNASFENLPSLDVSKLSDAEVANTMTQLLSMLRSLGASDLHISANSMPFIRRNLELQRFSNRVLTAEDSERLNKILLTEEQRKLFDTEGDLNFALEIGQSRFRSALMRQKDGVSGSYRLVPEKIKTLGELGFMPNDVSTLERLLDFNNGLILVTGPLGSGKTTTLASMVEVINQRRQDHIITVEDPIEVIIPSKGCNVTQRQIGDHTNSYRSALRGALREDPDVIIIGELHDLETIENAITASETGHLVIGTMHTGDASNTLNRLLDVFPPSQQPQIRAMTAGSLRGIVCQKLIPGLDGKLELVYEVLVNTSAVANIISDGKTHQLKATLQTGSKQGMCTMDACIFNKFNAGLLTQEIAETYIKDKSTTQQLRNEIAVREAKKLAEAMKKK